MAARTPGSKTTASPKEAAPIPQPPAAVSEPAAADAGNGEAATSPGSGGPGEALLFQLPATASDADGERDPLLLSFDLTREPTDDEWEAFELLLRHLRGHSHALRPPSDGEHEAFVLLSERKPDLAILDLRIPAVAVDNGPAEATSLIRIKAKVAGYRRAGMAHEAVWTDHPSDAFTSKQIEMITDDPNLSVEFA